MQIVCIKYNFYNLINCAARQTHVGAASAEGGGEGRGERRGATLPTLPHAALLADVGGPIKLAPGTLTKLILATHLHDNVMCDSMGSLIRRRLSYPFIKWPPSPPTSYSDRVRSLARFLETLLPERDNLSLIWVSFTRATKHRRRRTSRRRDTDESVQGVRGGQWQGAHTSSLSS